MSFMLGLIMDLGLTESKNRVIDKNYVDCYLHPNHPFYSNFSWEPSGLWPIKKLYLKKKTINELKHEFWISGEPFKGAEEIPPMKDYQAIPTILQSNAQGIAHNAINQYYEYYDLLDCPNCNYKMKVINPQKEYLCYNCGQKWRVYSLPKFQWEWVEEEVEKEDGHKYRYLWMSPNNEKV